MAVRLLAEIAKDPHEDCDPVHIPAALSWSIAALLPFSACARQVGLGSLDYF